jgi:LEA14-like dessication related protein
MQRTPSLSYLALLLCAALCTACAKPKPVELTPQSLQLSSIGPDGAVLALLLDVHNPNGFPISASAVSAVVELQDGSELGRGSATPAFTIPAEGNVSLPAQLSTRWTNVALLAPYALAAKPLPYRVRGSARLGGESLNVEVPFTISGQLTPEQVLRAGMRGAAALLPQR